MDRRFKKHELVVYGKNGVCEIEDIRKMNFFGCMEEYYILRPESTRASTVYVPVNKEILVSKMRFVMTKVQVDEILVSVASETMEWIDDKGDRLEKFNSIVCSGDSKAILLLIMCLRRKSEEREAQKRQLSSTDEGILKLAKELIDEEFSLALGCPTEKVGEYIKSRIA